MDHFTRLTQYLARSQRQIALPMSSTGSYLALVLHQMQRHTAQALTIVTADAESAQKLSEMMAWHAQGQYPVYHWPSWEILPYEHLSPHQDLTSQRLGILYHLNTRPQYTLITHLESVMQKVPPQSFVQQHCLLCQVGDRLAMQALRNALIQAGYITVDQVMAPGEFAIRGALLDLFPSGQRQPYRIELLDDEIIDIKSFDIDTQRSHTTHEQINILAAKEYPTHTEALAQFEDRWHTTFPKAGDTVPSSLHAGQAMAGIEQYQPLFFDPMPCLLDLLPENATLVYPDTLHKHAEAFWQLLQDRYTQHQGDYQRPLLPPSALYQPTEQLFHSLKQHPNVVLQSGEPHNAPSEVADAPPAILKPTGLQIKHQAHHPLQALSQWLTQYRCLVFFSHRNRATHFMALCDREQLPYQILKDWQSFEDADTRLGIAIGPASESWYCPTSRLCMLTENDLIGQAFASTNAAVTQGPSQDDNHAVQFSAFSLAQLQHGDAIVHVDHGVGRYRGLCHKHIGDHDAEFIMIAYADDQMLYTPVQHIHLIHPYSIIDIEHPPLHHLGGKKWQQQKTKAEKKILDTAAELLDTQAKRALSQCEPMQIDPQAQNDFDLGFTHELTDDQRTAVQHIEHDLIQPQPMHRLICGDVGFGKTEVAMRAAWIAAQNGKQVAVLCPTTVLAEQHAHTFSERFAGQAVNVACLSSFRTPKEQQKIKNDLAQGHVDIIIGTHSLLHSSIHYKHLGLLIIDEEHRFGVRQKNKIKAYRADTHILMLTATPIPRTLHYAFNKLSDLSIIATPPKKRLSIKTLCAPYEKRLILDAFQRELMRGGQVYYLYNHVSSMPSMLARLRDIMPQAKIEMAHGQMPKAQLEKIMSAFYQQQFNVLLCSTIIESGIDVPNANTIIIHQADQLGLAQLHQLRGRVGRSHHQAFAYLLYTGDKPITADAKKRLEALTSTDALGAGFMLANHDLEIRGAGELLGEEQSGHIDHLGSSLYHELLEKTMTALQKQPNLADTPPQANDCEIEVSSTVLIPEAYMPDVHARLMLYKRLAHARTHQDVDQIEQEMLDRFGIMPPEAMAYLATCRLKTTGRQCSIRQVKIHPAQMIIKLHTPPQLNLSAIIQAIQSDPKAYSLRGQDTIIIHTDAEHPAQTPLQKIQWTEEWLAKYHQRP